MSGGSDHDVQSDHDDQSDFDAEQQNPVDAEEATCDGEEVTHVAEKGDAVTRVAKEAEKGEVEVTDIGDEKVGLAGDENQLEEGVSHLSADYGSGHDQEVLHLVGDEKELENKIFQVPDNGYVYVCDCGSRHNGSVCGTRGSGVGKTLPVAYYLACAFVLPLPGPTWLGCSAECKAYATVLE